MNDNTELPELVSEGLDYFEKSGDAGDKKYVQAIREYIATRAPAAVPDGLLDRVISAEQRVADGHALRRIPADPTDVDLVLSEVRLWLEGKPAPFWIKTAAPAPAPAHAIETAAVAEGWQVESMRSLAEQLRARGDDLSTDAASWLEKLAAAPAPAESKPAEPVVDEAMVERALLAYTTSRGSYAGEVPPDRDDIRAALKAALRGEGSKP